ncbi:hypothetical protein M422DRAFT_256072 [Sphaerobolus stellatus SS14]|uniref:Uncharacterized protein n=1 Tax=Sphaerobolus stellatus (strain SS14) TaxID=990650 RepID=A0A0C9V1I1_SPHS4|nr:hypothetical protein M422DRAFT_256072 [Sphaerobolus stellatus SS14]
MQVDSSTSPVSTIQAFHSDPSTGWIIESAPRFIAIKHKMGCPMCDTSASHCMAAKRAYEICLAETDISKAIADAWPELGQYQDDYYRLLEDYNALKESFCSVETKADERRAKLTELYKKLDSCQATIKNLSNQAQSLEKQLQETKDNSAKLSNHKELILENKHLQEELEYYQGRVQYTLYRKDVHWAAKNGYHLSDIPAHRRLVKIFQVGKWPGKFQDLGLKVFSKQIPDIFQGLENSAVVSDGEDDDEDLTGLPTIPEEIPQDIPLRSPTRLACPTSKITKNTGKSVHEAGIPAIGGIRTSTKQKRIIADPPVSPAFRGTSDWVMESDVHDSEMCRLYVEGRALQPHEWSLDHTAVIFRIDEYARSLPGLPKNLVAHHDEPNWMMNVIKAFNVNPSGIPRNLRLEGLHINVDNADVWYWLNLIKPKYHGAEAEILLQSIFSTVGKWDQIIAGQWKRNDSPFLCSPAPERYTIHRNQKFDRSTFAYWLGLTKTIWNEVTLHSQLRANEIASLKEGIMNQFRIHDDLLPLVWESPFYHPPSMGEPMDQDESDPEPTLSQPTAGSSSLADRLDYGEGASFTCPPVDAHELLAHISYFDSLVPQGTVCEFTAELTEELYTDNLE